MLSAFSIPPLALSVSTLPELHPDPSGWQRRLLSSEWRRWWWQFVCAKWFMALFWRGGSVKITILYFSHHLQRRRRGRGWKRGVSPMSWIFHAGHDATKRMIKQAATRCMWPPESEAISTIWISGLGLFRLNGHWMRVDVNWWLVSLFAPSSESICWRNCFGEWFKYFDCFVVGTLTEMEPFETYRNPIWMYMHAFNNRLAGFWVRRGKIDVIYIHELGFSLRQSRTQEVTLVTFVHGY